MQYLMALFITVFITTNAMAEGAADAGNGQPPLMANLIFFGVIFAIFYFLLMRPQQKRVKAHKELVEGLKEGDEVITSSGIHGVIKKVDDDIVSVEVASNVHIKFSREAVSHKK